MAEAHINRIAVAVPEHDVHDAFIRFADGMLEDPRARSLFSRMASRADIDRRFSVMAVDPARMAPGDVNAYDLFVAGGFPSTAERMRIFERFAPALLRRALDNLSLSNDERSRIRHVIVTCCTGLYAPGLDFAAVDYLGLDPGTDRTMIGFMGCYAAINGLKLARHAVRSETDASVLLVNLELCSLHLQETQDLGEALSFLVFGDGCSASLISSDPVGLAIEGFRSLQVPGTRELITWRVGDVGFDMHLSGQVPASIAGALAGMRETFTPEEIALWAVHPGGRSVLDAVEEGLGLSPEALAVSRGVLRCFGNLSSATVMFVLAEMMRRAKSGERGCAMSFGPGLTAETMSFHAV